MLTIWKAWIFLKTAFIADNSYLAKDVITTVSQIVAVATDQYDSNTTKVITVWNILGVKRTLNLLKSKYHKYSNIAKYICKDD
jgi:hypothetical protein